MIGYSTENAEEGHNTKYFLLYAGIQHFYSIQSSSVSGSIGSLLWMCCSWITKQSEQRSFSSLSTGQHISNVSAAIQDLNTIKNTVSVWPYGQNKGNISI